FKLINTTFGRESDNKTLRFICETLEGQTEEDELVARLSADKFGLLVRFLSKEDLARRLAELSTQINRFNDSIKNPYILQFELGVCLVNEPGLPFDILLERASFARQHGIKLQFGQSSIAFYDDVAKLCEVIDKMKQVGFTCSLDDFGSGYSSLNLLKDIPVDTLKLDRSFFYSKNADDTQSRYVVGNIVDLAKKLNMQTVSEGIETLEWVEYLHGVKCDMVQGYVFAKPMPVGQFEKLRQKEKNA
ncbi:MAG: bifunctional diguanylate cyclase/phosphodiesterase, partial [Clostridia bacterium]